MLTSKERAEFRSQANGLDTIVHIGKGGITENLIKQANDALDARELIKCRVLEASMMTAKEACDALAEATKSEGVQVVGTKFVLYRLNPKKHIKVKPKKTVNPVKAGIKSRAKIARVEKERKNQYFTERSRSINREKRS